MADALNVFKTLTADITTINEIIYTAPEGNTAILLLAQVANVTETPAELTFIHFNAVTGVQTDLLTRFVIPGNDAASPITGKLVVEEGNSVRAFSNVNNRLVITLSVLESLNA
jgi:hypothetical protein